MEDRFKSDAKLVNNDGDDDRKPRNQPRGPKFNITNVVDQALIR